MRVLILLSNNPGDGYLVKLHTRQLVREIKKLISKRNNEEAMMTALMKGRIEQEIGQGEAHTVPAELILTKDRASWDLTKKR